MPDDQRPFRFFDNREKYLLFTTTCSEKQETAKRIGLEFERLAPRPPALRVFQAGAGEGTLLNRVLRQMHTRWPAMPLLVAVKEISPEFIRMAVRNLADRFREHPELVLVFTNMRYDEAPRLCPDKAEDRGRLLWRELALTGTSAHGFEAQINAEMAFVNEGWRYRQSPTSGSWFYCEPAVLVLYRADQAFVLDRTIPRKGETDDLAYDLVIASQPYRSRLPAEVKLRRVLAPLAKALAPGGRLIAIQARGDDPGMEIIHRIWPDSAPFATPRRRLLDALAEDPALAGRGLDFVDPPDGTAEFRHRLQLNPHEAESSIGTSTLLAAWNAASYVAQIEDQRLTEAMCHSGYLEATSRVLARHGGLWFNNECFVVARREG